MNSKVREVSSSFGSLLSHTPIGWMVVYWCFANSSESQMILPRCNRPSSHLLRYTENFHAAPQFVLSLLFSRCGYKISCFMKVFSRNQKPCHVCTEFQEKRKKRCYFIILYYQTFHKSYRHVLSWITSLSFNVKNILSPSSPSTDICFKLRCPFRYFQSVSE